MYNYVNFTDEFYQTNETWSMHKDFETYTYRIYLNCCKIRDLVNSMNSANKFPAIFHFHSYLPIISHHMGIG